MPTEYWIGIVGTLLALLCLWGAVRAGRRRRLIQDLPTCHTTGVFIGLVELKGTAEAEEPLVSYLARVPCVYYSWQVEEHWSRTVTETYTDSNGKTRTRTRHESGWATVGSGADQTVFYLQDKEGIIRVWPDGAEIEPRSVFRHECGRCDPLYYDKGPSGAVAHSDHRRLFTERAVPLHATVYVVGPAREREDVVAPEIRADADARMFLISTRSESQVASGCLLRFWLLGLLAVLLVVGGWIVTHAVRDVAPVQVVGRHVAIGAGVLAAWLLGWVWMVHNSLVDLRQRVQQAWSNVDVQLKRRADLIPNLVRVVAGLRDHERLVQTELATLRTQSLATRPGSAGPDPQACAGMLVAIVERYPELTANVGFGELQQSLIDTEQRIALAREYFNQIATFYNSRIESVPDCFIARLARLRPQPLIGAADFERAEVRVQLSDAPVNVVEPGPGE